MTFPSSPWTESLQRHEFVSEDEFKPLLLESATILLQLGNGALEFRPDQWPKRRVYLLARFSTELETWLDDFGARENRTYSVFRELTAMIRWLSLAMGSLVHLDSRVASYELCDREWAQQTLAPRVRTAAIHLGEMIQGCFRRYKEAWAEEGFPWPQGRLAEDSVDEHRPRQRLVRDLIEDEDGESSESGEMAPSAVRLAARFLSTHDYLKELGGRRREGFDELRRFLATRCTEENARTHEARVHNLQSYYDSLIAGSREEREHVDLRKLRGAISQAFHLLEAVTSLSHLYERHDVYERRGATRELFEKLVDEERLLDMIVNHLMAGAYESFGSAAPIARSLVEALTHQTTVKLELPTSVELHARPVSLIASVVNHHGTAVEAEIDGDTCNAASIMQLLVLVGSHPKARSMCFRGDETVLRDLSALFENRLGEDGLDNLPLDLEYLKP